MEAKYIAHKRFKYDGAIIDKGDEWTPAGGKWDESIKDHFVHVEEQPKPKRRTRKKSNGTSGK